jgi:hypothetical protein
VVKKTCRCMLKASCEKKYCSTTCGSPSWVTLCTHNLLGQTTYLATYKEF